MTDQLRINEDGRIVSQPVTWDGEPLYSEDSVREGLFDRSAFEQPPGQTAMEEPSLDAKIQSAARLGGSRQVNIRIVDGEVVSAWDPPCGRKVCADRECCAGRADCPCGMADES